MTDGLDRLRRTMAEKRREDTWNTRIAPTGAHLTPMGTEGSPDWASAWILMPFVGLVGIELLWREIKAAPVASGIIVLTLILMAIATWRILRNPPLPEADPTADRHHDAVQLLKILAMANNRIDDTDRQIIGAYIRDVPGSMYGIEMAAESVAKELPYVGDLDRHIDGAVSNLEPSELRTLVDTIREMRRVEKRMTPLTTEWFARAERRLLRPVGSLQADRRGLGLSIGMVPDEAPFDPGSAVLTHLERFDSYVAVLRRPDAPVTLEDAVSEMREPLATLDAIVVDEDVHAALDDLIDRQLQGAIAAHGSALLLVDDPDRVDTVLTAAMGRLEEGLEDCVRTQTGRAISRLDTVGRYIETKNPGDVI